MPIQSRYPIAEVIDAARAHYETSGRLVMLAYVMLGGVNTDAAEADALAELLRLMPARLSLVEYNHVPGLPFRRPTDDEREGFRTALSRLGVPVVRRYSGGSDIGAACGQLIAEHSIGDPSRIEFTQNRIS